MKPNNPAAYECPKDKRSIHTWRLYKETRRAMCTNCGLGLTPNETEDMLGPQMFAKEMGGKDAAA